jgi:hypothetical protein
MFNPASLLQSSLHTHKIAVRREGRWLKGVKERCTKKGRKIYITTKEKNS